MLDAALLLMSPSVTAQSLGEPVGFGRRPTMVRYRAEDRRVFVAALHRKWFESLCRIIGAEELLDDPRFADNATQAANADALIEAIEARLAARPAAEWEREFVRAGMPSSVVRSLTEILKDSHVQQRGVLASVEAPDLGRSASVVGAAFQFEHDGPRFQGPVPCLGQHTQEVLAELG
jgi:crotonobetainyl-CoA:carnitine CoA-transferase CaiB-like acyl-CoA transferase